MVIQNEGRNSVRMIALSILSNSCIRLSYRYEKMMK